MEHQFTEIQVSYKPTFPKADLPVISSPEQAYEALMKIWDHNTISYREEFIILLLNNAKQCLGWHKISIGGSKSTIVDPAAIFSVALKSHSSSLILAHNHPSGVLEASHADIALTKRLCEGARLIGNSIDDHIIITADGYLSFRDKGLI